MSRRTLIGLGSLIVGGVLALAAIPEVAAAHGGGFHGGGFHGGGFHGGYGGFHRGFAGFNRGFGRYGGFYGYPGLFLGGLGLGYGLGGLGWYYPYSYGGNYPYYDNAGYGFTYPNYYSYAYPSYSRYYSGYYSPSEYTVQVETPQTPAPNNEAHLQLIVPDNAEVWFDGEKTSQTGTVREYVSPPLATGKTFTYDVRVRYAGANGHVVDETRPIRVQANSWWSVDFTKPAPKKPEAAPPQTPPAKPKTPPAQPQR
jgi:uncharacterized protein (TIGR03000 family)